MAWSVTPNDLKAFEAMDQRSAAEHRCGNCKHFVIRHPLATTADCPIVAAIVAPTQQIQCPGFEPHQT